MTEANNVPPPPPPPPGSADAPAPGTANAPGTAPGDAQQGPTGPSLPYASPATPTGSGPPPYAGPAPTTDDKNMATIAHVLGIFTSFVGPLIVWLVKKDQNPFVEDQGKEALNFQLTLLIGYVVAAVTTIICIGPFIAVGLSVVAIIFGILGAMAANKGEAYRYPINIRFIK